MKRERSKQYALFAITESGETIGLVANSKSYSPDYSWASNIALVSTKDKITELFERFSKIKNPVIFLDESNYCHMASEIHAQNRRFAKINKLFIVRVNSKNPIKIDMKYSKQEKDKIGWRQNRPFSVS
jgi:hypothetical protein